MRRDPLVLGALAAGALGSALVFFFEAWFTRAAGVLLLFAFIVAGVFAIASPSFLEDEREDG
jgi:ABC-type phosphate/phosphonate transport system permease subunit